MKQDRAALEDRDVSIGQPRHLAEGLVSEMLGVPSAKRRALNAIGQSRLFQCPTHTNVAHMPPRPLGNPIEGGEDKVGHSGSPFLLHVKDDRTTRTPTSMTTYFVTAKKGPYRHWSSCERAASFPL